MPPRLLRDILIVDQSALARNMYQLLFTPQNRFRTRFTDEYQSLFKRSPRLRPDLLVVNSNALPRYVEMKFPCPTILIVSKDRIDIKEAAVDHEAIVMIEKPFYPYDLVSVANRLIVPFSKRSVPKRRRRGRQKNG